MLKAMARSSNGRYANVPELKAEIEAFLDDDFVAAARYSLFQRLQKWVRRHPTTGVTIVMGVLMLAIASLGFSLFLDSERRGQQEAVARAQAERQAAQEREQAASAREQAAAAREQAAEAREQTADARELAAEQETDRIAAEQREREERYRRLVQEEKFADLKRDLAVETHGRRDAAIEEFIGAWDSMRKQGYSQEKFSASLNRNDIDRYLGAFERRFRAFRRGAAELDQADFFYYGVLLHLGARRYADAIVQYDTVLKGENDHQAALNNRGLAYYQLGKYEQALKDQSRVVKLWPKQPAHWFNRGATYLQMQRYKEATADYRQLLSIDDTNAKAWLNLSTSLASNGSYTRPWKPCNAGSASTRL